jgi:ABC-type Fe3+ transport system permease subunit
MGDRIHQLPKRIAGFVVVVLTGNETISVAIYEMFEEGAFQLTNAAALMTLLSLVTVLPAIIIRLRSREAG